MKEISLLDSRTSLGQDKEKDSCKQEGKESGATQKVVVSLDSADNVVEGGTLVLLVCFAILPLDEKIPLSKLTGEE